MPSLRPRFVELLGREFDFTALTEVDDTVREEILEELPSEGRRRGRPRSRFRRRRPHPRRPARSRSRPKSSSRCRRPSAARSSASCIIPEESAGRRMQTEFIAVPPSWTVGDAIDHMRETVDLPDRFFELYVVDEGRKLLGAVGARPAAAHQAAGSGRRSDGPRPPAGPRHRRPGGGGAHVRALQPGRGAGGRRRRAAGRRADLRRHRRRHRGGGRRGHPRARRRHPRRRAGGFGLDIAKGRFNWLLVNLATAFLASSVLGLFEGSLEKMVALAVLAPIVASQGGNATTQTMTVAVRALATRELTDANAWRVIVRELSGRAASTGLPSPSSPASRPGPGSRCPASASSSGSP